MIPHRLTASVIPKITTSLWPRSPTTSPVPRISTWERSGKLSEPVLSSCKLFCRGRRESGKIPTNVLESWGILSYLGHSTKNCRIFYLSGESEIKMVQIGETRTSVLYFRPQRHWSNRVQCSLSEHHMLQLRNVVFSSWVVIVPAHCSQTRYQSRVRVSYRNR